MLLVAYDISDPKRLRKVAKLLQEHGIRVQNSTFELKVSEKSLQSIKDMLLEHIDSEYDKLFIFRISKKKKKSKRRGKKQHIWEMVF
jgi:CRISPR-associated protein Cas2